MSLLRRAPSTESSHCDPAPCALHANLQQRNMRMRPVILRHTTRDQQHLIQTEQPSVTAALLQQCTPLIASRPLQDIPSSLNSVQPHYQSASV
jgi:hypothetical protein